MRGGSPVRTRMGTRARQLGGDPSWLWVRAAESLTPFVFGPHLHSPTCSAAWLEGRIRDHPGGSDPDMGAEVTEPGQPQASVHPQEDARLCPGLAGRGPAVRVQ